ncbi:MAG: restriction endonuclease subunit S [Candidatus Gottesmanbacteria bacterium]
MKTNWQTKKLEDVANVHGGGTPPTSHPEYFQGNINWYSPTEIPKFEVTTLKESQKKISDSAIKFTTISRTNSVLLTSRATIGTVGILSTASGYSQGIKGIEPGPELDSWYLAHWLRSNKDEIINKASGTTFKEISTSEIKKLEIPIPPIAQQKKIVNSIENILGKIEKAKENTEKNLQNAKALFESYLQSIFANPGKDWEEKRLGDVCMVIAGQSPEGKFYNKSGRGLPFYQGKKEFEERYLGKPTTWTTDITKEAQNGDILMSVRAPVGPINFATQKICIGRGLTAIRAGKDIDENFLFYNLLSKEKEIIGNAGAVFASINKSDIESLKLFLPSLPEQKSIDIKLDTIYAETKKLEAIYKQKLADLEELKKSVLRKAFKGEL